jgi:hypothetical protein
MKKHSKGQNNSLLDSSIALHFSVADTGIGMNQATLNSSFNPLLRLTALLPANTEALVSASPSVSAWLN